MKRRNRLLRRFGPIVVGVVVVAVAMRRRHGHEAVEPVTSDAVSDASDDVIDTDEPAAETPVVDHAAPVLDLERIALDLEGVAMALARLDDGTYWTDEVTGEPLVEELLVTDPAARRNR